MNDQFYNEIGQHFAEHYEVTIGQMFGKPCLKTSNKAFAAFFKGEMVFKLGQQEVNLLLHKYSGATNWDPSGKKRPMKDWLQVSADFKNDWTELAKQAMDYVEENK